MPSCTEQLTKRGLIRPPDFVPSNVHYECLMGSHAYGTAIDSSDRDVYGFCIPRKDVVFPHLAGEINGFGRQKKRFDQFQQHHIQDPDALGGRGCEYDLSIYNIVRYLHLCLENNPNMLDSLFVPADCILHITAVGSMVRERRRQFLHKGAWPKLKGYAYSQLHKMASKDREGKRLELYERFGFDVKFAAHTVRLLYEAEMILAEGDLDLRRHSEHLKAIRRGEVPEAEIRRWAADKERDLEALYAKSTLPWGPDEPAIKQLLLDCLEHHYGSLAGCILVPDAAEQTLGEIRDSLARYDRLKNPPEPTA